MRVRRLRIPTRRKRSEGTLGARELARRCRWPLLDHRVVAGVAGGGLIISRHTKRWNSGRSEGMFPTTRVVELSWLALRGSPGSTDRFQPVCLFARVPRQCFSLRVYRVFGNCRYSRKGIRVPRHETRVDPPGSFSPSSFFLSRRVTDLWIISDRSLTQIDRDGERRIKGFERKKEEILLRETDQSSNILKNVARRKWYSSVS